MREIVADPALVAYCGLYCGACKRYLSEGCPGCHDTTKAGWCKVRACCIENGYGTCADCTSFTDPRQCAKFHNVVSRLFGVVFRSNRPACIELIHAQGREAFAAEMTKRRAQSLPR